MALRQLQWYALIPTINFLNTLHVPAYATCRLNQENATCRCFLALALRLLYNNIHTINRFKLPNTYGMQAAIYMGCMAMCNLILATVLQVGSSYTTEEEESHFLLQCREFAIRCS